MASVADLIIKINGEDAGATRMLGGIRSALGDIAKIAGGVIGAKFLADMPGRIMSVINASSDLVESQNKVNVVFGESSDIVTQFASTAARTIGQSKQVALEAAGTFGNLFTTMGIGQKEAAGLSVEMVGLASDLASFNNLSPEIVLEKLRAGLVGEAEPLKALGILINDTTMKAKAMELGLGGVNGELTEAEKVQARYALILEQSGNALGDFERNSLEFANAQRILSATFQDIVATLGSRLLPLITPLVVAFSQKLPGAADAAFAALDRLIALISGPLRAGIGVIRYAITNLIDGFRHFKDEAPGNVFEAIGERIRDVVQILTGAWSYAWTLARDAVMTFIQAFHGDWMDSDRVRPLHRVLGALGQVLGSVSSIMESISKGDFGSVFRDLLADIYPMLYVLGNLGRSLRDHLLDVLREIPDLVRDIDWSEIGQTVLDGIFGALSFGGGLFTSAVDIGASILGWVRDQVAGIDWSEVGASIRSGIGSVISFGGDVVGGAIDLGGSVLGWIRDTVSGVDWTEIATMIRDGIGSALSTAESLSGQAIDTASGIYGWIKSTVESTDWSGIATTIRDGISGAMSTLSESDNTGATDSAWSWIQETAIPALQELARIASEELSPALATIRDNISEMADQVEGDWGAISASISENAPSMIEALQTIGAAVAGLGLAFAAMVKSWSEALALLSGALPALGAIATPILVTLIESVGQLADVIGTLGRVAVAVKDGDWSTAWDEMKGIVERLGERIARIMESMGIDVEAAVGAIAGYIEGQKEAVETAVGALGDAIKFAVEWPQLLYNAGVDVAQGLIDGMGSLLQSVRDKAGELASAAKDAVTGALGIQSPSRVFMQIGHDVVEGLAIGLSDSGEATDASRALAQSIVDQWNLVLADIPRIVDGTLMQDLQAQLEGLGLQLALAIEQGAPAAIVDAIRAAQAAVREQIATVDAALGTEVIQQERWKAGLKRQIDGWAEAAKAAAEKIESHWNGMFGSFDAILDGSFTDRIKAELKRLNDELTIALALNLPNQIVQGIKDSIAAAEQQLEDAGRVVAEAIKQGIAVGMTETAPVQIIGSGNAGAVLGYANDSPFMTAAQYRENQASVTLVMNDRELTSGTSRTMTENHRFTVRMGSLGLAS